MERNAKRAVRTACDRDGGAASALVALGLDGEVSSRGARCLYQLLHLTGGRSSRDPAGESCECEGRGGGYTRTGHSRRPGWSVGESCMVHCRA
jgi:hypothetical protein